MSNNYLDQVAAELDRCNKCGFCQTACPTYRVTGFEWMVTRGRVSLVQDVQAGTLSILDPDFGLAMDSCFVCGACIAACPPQIQIHDIIYAARRERARRQGLHWVQKLVFRQLLPRPRLLKAVVKVGRVAERLGLRDWAERAGVLKRWPALERANRTGPRLPAVTARALIGPVARPAQPRARVAYFIACTKEFLYPEAARATVRVLEANDVEIILPPAVCCGLPNQSGGDVAGAQALARQNVRYLQGLNVDAIIVDEGSCASHMLDYADLLADTPEAQAAAAVQAKVVDLATFLDRLGLRPPGPLPVRVTWHDPCSLKYYMQAAAAPRRLLAAVPGVQFVEAKDAAMCCGGAGAVMITQPGLSDEVLSVKMDGFAATEAQYVVTMSPSCMMQLQRGARERGLGAKVLYLSEFLELAYKTVGQ